MNIYSVIVKHLDWKYNETTGKDNILLFSLNLFVLWVKELRLNKNFNELIED